jgi:hypothetical protein
MLHLRPSANDVKKDPDAPPKRVVPDDEIFDDIVQEHCSELGHTGRDKTITEIARKYYGISSAEVKWLLPHGTVMLEDKQ